MQDIKLDIQYGHNNNKKMQAEEKDEKEIDTDVNRDYLLLWECERAGIIVPHCFHIFVVFPTFW